MKTLKIVDLLLVLVTAVLMISACDGKNIAYLNEEQNVTLGSARTIPGMDDQVYELNYTADYKMDEFIKTITENMFYHTTDCRMTMKKLLAEGSGVDPIYRLTNGMPGCSSVICKNAEGIPVIGRNYDLDISSGGATVVLHTAPKNGYKSVGVADCGQVGLSLEDIKTGNAKKELLLYAPYYTMDGVNEKGFACSIMMINEGRSIQDTGKNWLPSTLVVRYLLDNAESVDHAVKLLNETDLKSDYFVDPVYSEAFGFSFHWAITDASGNKAIIEYVDGKMIVNKYPLKVEYNEADDSMKVTYPKEEKGYLIATNFFVSEGFENTAHDSGKWRYETLEKAMSENLTPSDAELRDIMKSAKYFMNDRDYMFALKEQGKDTENPDNWDWITIWTDILNTSEKTLTLWMKENYEVGRTFGLEYKSSDSSENNLFVGSALNKSSFVMPVYGDILTNFSDGTHNGIDIAAKISSPVKACADGRVTDIRNDEGLYGITVVIDHGNGLFSYYTGLNESLQIKLDQKIKIGDVIGSLGTTNVSENNLAPHLHFAMKLNGSWVNPSTYIK